MLGAEGASGAAAVAVAVAGALVVVVGVLRGATARRVRSRLELRPERAPGSDGIVVGAQTIYLRGTGSRGALLLHGFNDTPQSLSHLAHALHARGWTVRAPLLASHGRGFETFRREGAARLWLDDARQAWRELRAESSDAVLIGQSMGGAIAVVLSTEAPPRALVLLAPFLQVQWLARVLASVWPLWGLAVPTLLANPHRGMLDAAARSENLGTGLFTPRLVRELARVTAAAWACLPRLSVPTLALQARSDYRVPPRHAARAFARIGAPDKTLEWIEGSGHIIAADARRDAIVARVSAWLDARLPG